MGKSMVTIYTQAYNVEAYITKCIESVLGQTYGEWEWILVENGSTDNTKAIIQAYEKRDTRIRCIYHDINQKNFAQDYICEYARGEYIVKLDSDDFWDSRYLEKLVYALETSEADLACCKATVLDEVNNEQYYHGFRKYEGIITAKDIAEQYGEIEIDMNTYWAKLMKRDLFIKACNTYRKLYGEKIKVGYCGDTTFMFCYLNECNKSVFLMEALYFYRLHRKNASKTVIDTNALEDCLASFDVKQRFLQKSNAWSEQNAERVYRVFWGNLDTIFKNMIQNDVLNNRQKIEAMGKILSDDRVLKIRKEFCDEHIRKVLSTYIAWCYTNMEKECENVFLKMLITMDPELFSGITIEQYNFLISEKILIALLILGEKEEALQHLENIWIDNDDENYKLYSYFHDRLI